jgi:heme-degrading monooxygenase HmoA
MTPGSYAVIFVSHRTAGDPEGYEAMAERMAELARAQPGFLGMRSPRADGGVGITVCYWSSADAIAAWRQDVDHAAAQQQGKDSWYSAYEVTIARVERFYGSGTID